MIDSLERWVSENQEYLISNNIYTSVRRNEVHNPSLYSAAIEFETNKAIGVVIVWNTGFCDIHVLGNDEKGKELFIENYELKLESELSDVLRNTFDKVLTL